MKKSIISLYCCILSFALEGVANEFRWADVPRKIQEDVTKSLLLGRSVSPSDPQGGAVEAYLNKWVGEIDSTLRQNSQLYDFSNIPRPHVLITKNRNLDAVATNAPVCFKVSIRFSEKRPAKLAPGAYLRGDRTISFSFDPRSPSVKGEYTLMDRVSGGDCVQRELSPIQLPSFLAFLKDYTSCQTEVFQDASETGVRLRDCHLGMGSKLVNPEQYDGASSLILSLESNWVTITTGLLATMENETDLIYTLAHELNHFYAAHLVVSKDEYNYFYIETHERKDRPEKAVDLTLQKWPSELDALLGNLYGLKLIDLNDGKPYVAAPFVLTAIELAKKGRSPLCSQFQASIVKVQDKNGLFDTPFPNDELPLALRPQYEVIEDLLIRCMETQVVSDQLSPNPSEIGILEIQQTFAQVSGKMRINTTLLIGKQNLREVFETLTGDLETKIARTQELLALEKTTSLGHYSFEQDADEKALYVLNEIGISPFLAVPAILRLGVQRQSQIGNPYLPVKSAQECLNLVDLTIPLWSPSSYPYIHIGTVTDPHHTYCHRAKNMFDRSVINGYVKVTQSAAPQRSDWAKLLPLVKLVNPKSNPRLPLGRRSSLTDKADFAPRTTNSGFRPQRLPPLDSGSSI